MTSPAESFLWLAERRRWLAGASALLLLAWVALAVAVFERLPDTIPMHFTLTGAPTRFESTTLLRWLAPPLITAGLVLLLPLIGRADRWLNSQGKFAHIDVSNRPELLQLRSTFLLLTLLLVGIAMVALHLGIWMVATWQATGIPPVLLMVSGASVISILLLIIPFRRAGRARRGVTSPAGGPVSASANNL